MKPTTIIYTKAYTVRLRSDLLNQAHEVIDPAELRLRIKRKINNYLKTLNK